MSQETAQQDLSFRHLQLEFARIDVLLHRLLQRRSGAGEGGDSELFDMETTSGKPQAAALLQRPLGYGYEELESAANAPYERALASVQENIATLVTTAEEAGYATRLQRLATLLQLDRFELDALLLGLAPALDEQYGQLYAVLQGNPARQRPSLSLILDVAAPAGPDRLLYLDYFAPTAPLARYHLLRQDPQAAAGPVGNAVYPDSSLVSWLLLGHYQANEQLASCVTFHGEPHAEPALLADDVQQAVVEATGRPEVLVLFGPDRLARETAAQLYASEVQRPLLELDLEQVIAQGVAAEIAVELLLRDALLTGAVPHVQGWDACLSEDAPDPALLSAICQHPLPTIISGQGHWQPRRVARERRLRWLAFPIPVTEQRLRLLRHFLGHDGGESGAFHHSGWAAAAGQFRLASGPLRDLVETARDLAGQRQEVLSPEHIFAAARAHSNPRLATLARKITPRYDWDDLVLPEDQIAMLRELVAMVRQRPRVLEQWGVGRKLTASAGVTALFFGPPGTGKTMAAEVIAGELGQDLYKIDLSSVVSKYIGETEKNLERIFREAESSSAILFFDEADAIFGKRSEVKDAHDRYANIEISYLLQRMEAYDGVTILATNLRANLDEAFMRRLHFALDFPFPRVEDRLHIWRTLFPPGVPRGSDLDFELLAERFEIPGGNIRNIIVSAAYLAAANGQEVTMEHMMHAVRRELQKMGRLLSEQDLNLE
jgi:ATP-dependent 26S proteasome regulatory subunit